MIFYTSHFPSLGSRGGFELRTPPPPSLGRSAHLGYCVANSRAESPIKRWSPHTRRPPLARRHPFPRVFSACSRRQLRAFFRKGGGACLSNTPHPGLPVQLARCGNGFVEAGEDCDCGSGQVRSACPVPGDHGWPPSRTFPEVGALRPPVPSLPFPSQKCQDPCCFAHNCSLRAGAQCAHGDCCARCQVRAAKTWGLAGGF